MDANPKLKNRIRSGEVSQENAASLERACLEGLAHFDRGHYETLAQIVSLLHEYGLLLDPGKDRRAAYERTLLRRPWKDCCCPICNNVGIHVVIFRGAERNKRRGFHNLYAFNNGLQRELGAS